MELMVLFMFIFLILAVIGIALYVIGAVGINTMAKRRGIDNAWLAYIPIAQVYIVGCIIDNINAYKNKKTDFKIILLILSILGSGSGSFVATEFSYGIAILLSLGFRATYLYALYFIFKDYSKDSEVLWIVLSAIFQIDFIVLFALRKKVPISMCFRAEDEWQFDANKLQLQSLWNQYHTTPQMQDWTGFLITNFTPSSNNTQGQY